MDDDIKALNGLTFFDALKQLEYSVTGKCEVTCQTLYIADNPDSNGWEHGTPGLWKKDSLSLHIGSSREIIAQKPELKCCLNVRYKYHGKALEKIGNIYRLPGNKTVLVAIDERIVSSWGRFFDTLKRGELHVSGKTYPARLKDERFLISQESWKKHWRIEYQDDVAETVLSLIDNTGRISEKAFLLSVSLAEVLADDPPPRAAADIVGGKKARFIAQFIEQGIGEAGAEVPKQGKSKYQKYFLAIEQKMTGDNSLSFSATVMSVVPTPEGKDAWDSLIRGVRTAYNKWKKLNNPTSGKRKTMENSL